MGKTKEIVTLGVMGALAAFGLAACGDTPRAATPIATTAATIAPTAVATVMVQATAEPTAMIGMTAEPTAMMGGATATTGRGGGGMTVTGPAADILTKYYDAYKKVTTYHLTTEVQSAGATVKTETDFQSPDRSRTIVDLGALGKSETLVIGDETYTKAPGTDSYVMTKGVATASDVKDFNFLPFIQSAEILGEETINGIATTHVKYSYDADKMMAEMANQTGTPVPTAAVAQGVVTTELWIDKATGNPVRQKATTAAGDAILTYSKINEPISPPIEKPTNVMQMPGMPTVVTP